MKRTLLSLAMAGTIVCGTAGQAQAVQFGFGCITGNNLVNCADGEAQLFVDVTDAGNDQVSFLFSNTGPVAMSITDVYFDDGTLLGIASIINGAGVDFSQGAAPGDLPGGNDADPDFVATVGFTADSNPPTQSNGVNPGETLTILFDLINGQTFADTLAAIALGGADGGLRIGIHVQGFGDGGSESFVNEDGDGGSDGVTPEPTVLALFGAALAMAGARMRRRK